MQNITACLIVIVDRHIANLLKKLNIGVLFVIFWVVGATLFTDNINYNTMKESEIKEFYFGEGMQGMRVCCNGDMECRMRCFEWSDGRLGCEGHNYTLQDFKKAYRDLMERNETKNEDCVQLSLEIIRAFNDEYNRTPGVEKVALSDDFALFVKSILYVLENGDGVVPVSIMAELCREAGLFDKCLEFDATACGSVDEREIIAEVQFRAAKGDSRPFIIEHCEYYTNNLRLAKRYPCPITVDAAIV